MPIRLNIEAETVEEFDELIARFSRSAGGVMPELTGAEQAQVVEEPKTTKGRGKKAETAAAPTQNPDGTPIAPVSEPVPQPTPGGTDAPPAESIPPNQVAAEGKPADGAAAEGGSASQAASSDTSAVGEATSSQPSASSPDDNGEVTVQQLKDAMADLLKAKSASVAMQVLEAATGCKSLTSGSPSVVEKAKDDPDIIRVALDALVAGKA